MRHFIPYSLYNNTYRSSQTHEHGREQPAEELATIRHQSITNFCVSLASLSA